MFVFALYDELAGDGLRGWSLTLIVPREEDGGPPFGMTAACIC